MISNILLLTLVIFLESASEPAAGKLAVASVIWNRAEGRAANVEKVLTKRKQFSCLNRGLNHAAANAKRMRQGKRGAEAWLDCVLIAERIMDGTFQPTISANHYYNPSKASPSWGEKLRGKVTIGNHTFGELP